MCWGIGMHLVLDMVKWKWGYLICICNGVGGRAIGMGWICGFGNPCLLLFKKMKSILICPRKVDNIRHRHPGFSQYGMYRERKASEGFCEGNFSRGEPGQNVLWQL